jgi:hypothetical protein
MPTLFEKSGAEGQYRRFKFEISAIVRRNDLPGFDLSLVNAVSAREPMLHMARRSLSPNPLPLNSVGLYSVDTNKERAGEGRADLQNATPSPVKLRRNADQDNRPLRSTEPSNYLTDETLEHVRKQYRGWDFHALHAEFREWIGTQAERRPERYQSAFIGFVKQYHEKNRHHLRG